MCVYTAILITWLTVEIILFLVLIYLFIFLGVLTVVYCNLSFFLPNREKMMSHQSCTHREQEPWVLHLRMPSDATAPTSATAGVEKSKDCKILVWIASFHPKCYVETVSVCGAAPALHHLVCTPWVATLEPYPRSGYSFFCSAEAKMNSQMNK